MADLSYYVQRVHHLLSCLRGNFGLVCLSLLELWCLTQTLGTSSLQISGIQSWLCSVLAIWISSSYARLICTT